MQTDQLIASLLEQTQPLMEQAKELKDKDLSYLTWRSNASSWNILECYEHLNRYGDFYLPQMALKIKESNTQPEAFFRSGFLGNYFANSMLPKHKLKKMKTFRDKNPLNAPLDITVIDRFLQQQEELILLLHLSKTVSLNKVKISTSISQLIQLKLGDAFRFYINHMLRHSKQIENVSENMAPSGIPR
jgi:hypothetical protein